MYMKIFLSPLSGEYRGAACQECNGKMRLRSNFLPVFFHNFRGYDSHVICAEALGKVPGWETSVIAQTKEKYMAMDAEFEVEPANKEKKKNSIKMKLGFRDSFQFLTDSLGNLVKNLSPTQLQHTRRLFPNTETFQAVALSKGVFPYSYLTGPDRLKESSLPAQEHFFDQLTQSECSDNGKNFIKYFPTYKFFIFSLSLSHTLYVCRLPACSQFMASSQMQISRGLHASISPPRRLSVSWYFWDVQGAHIEGGQVGPRLLPHSTRSFMGLGIQNDGGYSKNFYL